MEYLSFLVSYSLAFISCYLLIYFQIYSKLKEEEHLVKNSKGVDYIKRLFLKEGIREIGTLQKLLFFFFIIFIVLSIYRCILPTSKMIPIAVIISILVFLQILVFLAIFISHNRIYRDTINASKNSKSIEQFLTILGFDKEKSVIIAKMINSCKKNKEILNWFLYYIGLKEDVLIKDKKR